MKITTKLAAYLLRKSDLPIEDRTYLSTVLLDKLGALPIRDIITSDKEGSLVINGRPLEIEQARSLRESARGAKNNLALKLIRDQVLYTAITIGVHKLENERQSFFSRAAIWFGQQQDSFLNLLAQDEQETI